MVDENGNDVSLGITNIKNIGHDVNGRISDDAVIRVALQEQRRIKKKFELAKKAAQHAGRETIREEDILVVEQFMSEELPE